MSSGGSRRLASLDQFRGYTVAGMFLVNYLGGFAAAPYLFKHHLDFCSYADTIMPQFFFAVGFSMRLSFGRRSLAGGAARAYWHAVQRALGLVIVAFIIYQAGPSLPAGAAFSWDTFREVGFWEAVKGPLKQDWFQTLTHIAVTTVWILPVIRASARWRVLYLAGSAVLHLILSHLFYIEWVNARPAGIDGGPLGFLTWSIPTLVGTLACDAVLGTAEGAGGRRGVLVAKLLGWSVLLMLLGWIASCGTRWYDLTEAEQAARDAAPARPEAGDAAKLADHPVFPSRDALGRWFEHVKAGEWPLVVAEPPFVPPPHSREKVVVKGREVERDLSARYRPWNYWMMSQRCGTISYLTFSAGLSLAVFALFYVLADVLGITIGVFRTLGVNALFGYVLHSLVDASVRRFAPGDMPPVPMWISFAVYFYLTWLVLRSLEKNGIYIKL